MARQATRIEYARAMMTLGLDGAFDAEALRAAHRRAVVASHPDMAAGDADAERRTRLTAEANAANDLLRAALGDGDAEAAATLRAVMEDAGRIGVAAVAAGKTCDVEGAAKAAGTGASRKDTEEDAEGSVPYSDAWMRAAMRRVDAARRAVAAAVAAEPADAWRSGPHAGDAVAAACGAYVAEMRAAGIGWRPASARVVTACRHRVGTGFDEVRDGLTAEQYMTHVMRTRPDAPHEGDDEAEVMAWFATRADAFVLRDSESGRWFFADAEFPRDAWPSPEFLGNRVMRIHHRRSLERAKARRRACEQEGIDMPMTRYEEMAAMAASRPDPVGRLLGNLFMAAVIVGAFLYMSGCVTSLFRV